MLGKVYKIIHNQSNIIYIGSTTDTLRNRWQEHKHRFNQNNRSISIYPYFEKYGIENFKIILIKEYEVCDRKHIFAYEQLWINKLSNINKYKSFQPLHKEHKRQYDIIHKEHKIQYRKNNKEYIAEKTRKWYANNTKKALEYKKEYNNNNKESINNYKKEWYEKQKNEKSKKINCECGSIVAKYSLNKHLTSKKHLKLLDTRP